MSKLRYTVCYHCEDYTEKADVWFNNPIATGDRITDGMCEQEYKVFQVVHITCGGGSFIHVKPCDET